MNIEKMRQIIAEAFERERKAEVKKAEQAGSLQGEYHKGA